VNCARRDLCGGHPAMGVPTAISMGATPTMNRSAQGGTRSSLHYGGEGVLIHPPYQGVCGRHGTEELHVTSGGLAKSAGGAAVSEPISPKAKGQAMLGQ
jgi:hypothetical protein